jgi:uncharacterized membrane protein
VILQYPKENLKKVPLKKTTKNSSPKKRRKKKAVLYKPTAPI